MSTLNRTAIVNLLKEGEVAIKFTKTDGSVRVMNATLDVEGVEVSANPTSGASLNVFDNSLGEWRAFRWEALTEVNGEAVTSL